jgi:hypothetical protein
VTASFPVVSLISGLILPVSQQLVGLCLCVRGEQPIDVARVNQELCFGSTRSQTFEVGWNLKARGVGYCPRGDLSLDSQLEDVLRSEAITCRSEGGDTLFLECLEDRPQGRPGFVIWVLGEPGLKIKLDTLLLAIWLIFREIVLTLAGRFSGAGSLLSMSGM